MTKWPEMRQLSDEEEEEFQRAIASDRDTWEVREEDLKTARPFREVFPEIYAKMKAGVAAK